MEHLTLPHDYVLTEADHIPFVCSARYDGGPFLTYPLRSVPPRPQFYRKSDEDTPIRRLEDLNPTPTKELADFLITWLFFGLLSEVFGDSFRYEDFLTSIESSGPEVQNTTDIKYRITTKCLVALTKAWVQEHKSLSKELKLEVFTHLCSCLWACRDSLETVQPGIVDAHDDFDQNTRTLIATVCEVIQSTIVAITLKVNRSDDDDRDRYPNVPGAWQLFFDSDRADLAMVEHGWCPSQLSKVRETTASLSAMVFFSKMKLPDDMNRHKNCSSKMCIAFQNNLSDYPITHQDADCKCEMYELDTKAVNDALNGGSYPVLKITPRETSNTDVDVGVVSATEDTNFTAISHVWAHGMGNPTSNALPHCQLRFVASAVNALQIEMNRNESSTMEGGQTGNSNSYIWLDTLCCPIGPPDMKTIALQRLKAVYGNAEAVLAIDKSVEMCDINTIGSLEICARISISPWAQRLWTLQEASLNINLWIHHRVAPVSMVQIVDQNTDMFEEPHLRALSIAINLTNDQVRLEKPVSLPTIAEGLLYRSVSVKSDEALCIANLLDLETEEILQVSDADQRMSILWSAIARSMDGIPKKAAFHKSLKLNIPGFKWAPASLLNVGGASNESSRISLEGDLGLLTPQGLKLSLSGMKLYSGDLPLGTPSSWIDEVAPDRMRIREAENSWYIIYVVDGGPKTENDEFSLKELFNQNEGSLVLLFLYPFGSRESGSRYRQDGLLGVQRKHEDGQQIFESKRLVHIMKLEASYYDMYEAAYKCSERLRQDQAAADIATYSAEPDEQPYADACERLSERIYALSKEELTDPAYVQRVLPGDDTSIIWQGVVEFFACQHAAVVESYSPSSEWIID